MMGENSTSTRVGHLIKNIVQQNNENISVEVLPLLEYDMKACLLCGACSNSSRCIYDEAFNRLLNKIEGVDGIFFIVPHYSTIPAKLIMIFEKLNEIIYAGWIKDPEFKAAWNNMPVAIIGHGGMVETMENLRYYHDQLVTRVADTLRSFSFLPIGLNEEYPNGACFGLSDTSCVRTREDAVYPDIIQDWDKIEPRIKPLVHKMITMISEQTE
jgi:NAD(P)H-dependent FMN reductase